jgi:hypothetical protein
VGSLGTNRLSASTSEMLCTPNGKGESNSASASACYRGVMIG